MPGNQQLEFINDIIHRFPHVPILLVTGYPTLPALSITAQLPITSLLIKPSTFEELRTCIHTALQESLQEPAQDTTKTSSLILENKY